MAEEKESAKKIKRPQAKKRLIQSEKKRLINKSFKSVVRTALNNFDTSLSSKEEGSIKAALSNVYSVMDSGVKRGVFKINKAKRAKERAAAKVAALSK